MFCERQPIRADVHNDAIALGEFAFEDAHGKRVQDPPLNGSLERASTVAGIIPLLHEEFLRPFGELDFDFPVGQSLHQPSQLDIDDLLDVIARQGVEEDDFVDAIEEFRPEVLPQGIRDLTPRTLADLS